MTVTARDMTKPSVLKDADFVQSLARGLVVIRSFDEDHRQQTLSEVASRTGLNRATVRRLLLTLADLGYIKVSDRLFALSPAVLQLGYAYFSALGARAVAEPYLETLAEQVTESCSMTVLDGTDITYVACAPTKRIFSLALGIGSRLPAFVTSMGRVLLADLAELEVDAILAESDLRPHTPKTVCDPDGIKAELKKARDQGWCLLDEELELGIRTVAAPIRDENGRVIAAINVSTTVARSTKQKIIREIVPLLLTTADEISVVLQSR